MVTKTFEQILEAHNYTVFGEHLPEKTPVIFIADVHSVPMRQRTNAFLRDILTGNDIFFGEGENSHLRYRDIERQFFDDAQLPIQVQQQLEALCEQAQKLALTISPDQYKKFSYRKANFPCKVEYSDDPILIMAAGISKNTILALERNISPDDSGAKVASLETATRIFKLTIHYRNLAIARTIQERHAANPTSRIYQVIGAQHVFAPDFLKINSIVNCEYSGELCDLMTSAGILCCVVGPSDLEEELLRVLSNPELALD